MSAYLNQVDKLDTLRAGNQETWKGINAEYAARLRMQSTAQKISNVVSSWAMPNHLKINERAR